MLFKTELFRKENLFTGFVVTTDENMGDRNTNESTLRYLREKAGGTDIGHVFTLRVNEAFAKVGINFSLLMQALEKYLEVYSNFEIAINSSREFTKQDLDNFSTLPPAQKRKIAEVIAKATENTLKNSEKWQTLLGYIVGNYLRLTESQAPKNESKEDKIARETAKKEKEKSLKNDISDGFTDYLNTAEGLALLDTIMKDRLERAKSKTTSKAPQTLTSNEVYSLATKLFTAKPALRDLFAYCAFVDQMCAFGQQLNNDYMHSVLPDITVAKHNLLVTRNQMGLYQVSTLVPNAISLQQFLVEPFVSEQKPGEENEAWIARGRDALLAKLKNKPIKGLCAGILFRHLMGESADLGMDNMILVEKDTCWELVNIDITGPRLPRQNDFAIPRSTDVALGWENTLKAGDKDTLLKRLFDKSVFKARGIEEHDDLQKVVGKKVMGKEPTPEFVKMINEGIFNAITQTLKDNVTKEVEIEVAAAKNWLVSLDSKATVAQVAAKVELVYNNLHENLKFDPSRLESYMNFFTPFITTPCEIAKSLVVAPVAEDKPMMSSL